MTLAQTPGLARTRPWREWQLEQADKMCKEYRAAHPTTQADREQDAPTIRPYGDFRGDYGWKSMPRSKREK